MADPVVTYYAVTFKDSFLCQGVMFTPNMCTNVKKSVAVPVSVYGGNADDGSTFASHCLTATPLYGSFPS